MSDTVSSLAKRSINLIREYISKIKTLDEINSFSKYINRSVKIVSKALINKIHETNIHENPQSLEASLAHLKYYRLKLKKIKKDLLHNKSSKVGQGLSNVPKKTFGQKVLWEDLNSCFKGRIRSGFISNIHIKDPAIFLTRAYKSFVLKIKKELAKSMLKVNVVFSGNFIQPSTLEIDLKTFATRNNHIDSTTNIREWYHENVVSVILNKLESFAEKDSGWALYEILGLKVNINQYDPIKFGNNSSFVEVPNFIKKKHCIINVQNNDQFCFLWSVVSALYPVKNNPHRTSSYPNFENVLRYDNISFPITIRDIEKFEIMNNLSINLYCIEEKNKIFPARLSTYNKNNDKNIPTINLLMLPTNNMDEEETHHNKKLYYHFVWIKHLSRLLSHQLSTHEHKTFICERCLNYFTTEDILTKHKIHCQKLNQYSVSLPRDTSLKFKNHLYKKKVPFVIYADLESILVKCSQIDNNIHSKTIPHQKHIACSIAYYLKCSFDDSLSKFQLYRNQDCIQWFVKELKDIAEQCDKIFKNKLPMEKLSYDQERSYKESNVCHICNKTIESDQIKVRDHNHLTGKFRGPAHQRCNLNYQDSYTIPVVFHNLSGYDAHFIIKELSTAFAGLTFDAMLKSTGICLELLSDIDMIMFIERGIRGGVSQCSNRYAKANNHYMKDGYNSNEELSYLMYFDVNNLYGAAMSQYLPYGNFRFLEDFNITEILNTSDTSNDGYIIECDLEYPTPLHDLHSDLPLAPQHLKPPNSKSKLEKLLLTLFPKINYIVHYRNLKMYLRLGLKITKVHRVLTFNQSPWLKEYIDLNTRLRQQSQNEFEKDFFKLMINAIYGKCMENVRKHKDIRIVTRWDGRYGMRDLISKPNFHSSVIFEEDMSIVEMNKLNVVLNKPIYVGFCILDISKIFIYEFHYDYIKNKFGNNAKLLYTDTDSLIYHFKTEDIYKNIKEDIHRFDTSDYKLDNKFNIELKNKKCPGLMKDENHGKIMLEFVGLRSKMYFYTVDSDTEDEEHDYDEVGPAIKRKKFVKKSKGCTKSSIKHITFNDYKKCLFDLDIFRSTQRLIRSKKHSVYSIKQEKVVLSPYDDKRILLRNTTDTRPWGYAINLT
ncbi:hypothetical protein TcasGA2_TC005292 [Tribolium castaneum]|uniref:DNA-directed DNA polymerase n=1 Tax=Tribolium castaneum TaxID=7070 RepID=D7EKZ0_TRICA|nr:hypothetical protein TcasGA2_TC005292 [Tribolium castaneum]